MVPAAFYADGAQGRNADFAGIRRVGSAAAQFRTGDRPAVFFADFLCHCQQFHVAGQPYHGVKAYTVVHFGSNVFDINRLNDLADFLFHHDFVFRIDIPEVAFHFAVGRSRIGNGAAFDDTYVDVVAFGEVGQFFNLDDLVGHFQDGAAAIFRIIAYMAAAAESLDEETPAAFPLYGNVMIGETGFKVEAVFRPFGFFHDHFRIVGERVSRFFVRYKDHLAGEIIAGIFQGAQGRKRDTIAAFHIQHAGAVSLAVFNGKGTFGHFAFIEYGINMTH